MSAQQTPGGRSRPGFTRRTLLGGLAGTAGLAAVAGPLAGSAAGAAGHAGKASPSSSGSAPAQPVSTTSQPSALLAGSVGVTAVTSADHGIWTQDALIASRLAELGVRHVRTGLFDHDPGQITRMKRLGANGIRFNTIMGNPTMKGGTPEQLVDLVGSQLSDVVVSLEGANEWNLSGHRDWATEVRAHHQRLYRAARSSSATSSLPVLGPSLGNRRGYAELGDLSSYLDYGNIHLYQGGFPPGYRVPTTITQERINCGPTKPMVVTETGWHNAYLSRSTHRWTSEQAAGIYAPRVFLDYFQRGIPRVFVHELVDEPADPSMTNFEAHFGLLRSDFSRKPAFTALTSFLRLLDPPTSALADRVTGRIEALTHPAPHRFTTTPSDLRSVTVTRADGAWIIFLWRDVSVWDADNKRAVTPGAKPVSLRYLLPMDVSVTRPSSSSQVTPLAQGTTGTDLDVGGEVVALVVTSSLRL